MSPVARHPGWLDEGEDPDYRYSLANERTYLAWSRTALSLLAGAVAVEQLASNFGSAGTRRALGLVLVLGGLSLFAAAWCHRRPGLGRQARRRVGAATVIMLATAAATVTALL